MNLKVRKPPAQALATLHAAVRRLYPASTQFAVIDAYPLYAPSLATLGDAGKLASERLKGWIFVLRSGKGPRMIAEVHRRGTSYRFACLSHGREGSVLLRHLKKFPNPNDARKYELRILRMPQVHLLALWHHEKREELIQILPIHGQRYGRRRVAWKELVSKLQAVAYARGQFNDQPSGFRDRRRSG
jgi:hypothetical protein